LKELAELICREENRCARAFRIGKMNDLSWPIAAAIAPAELVRAVFASRRAKDVAWTMESAARVSEVAIFLTIRARAGSEAGFKLA